MKTIEEALKEVERIVQENNHSNDLVYFQYHRERFRKMAETVCAKLPKGSAVLDIGSHYLHSSILLSLLGYRVDCMDVTEFCTLPFIQERAAAYGLTQIEENNLEKLSSLSEVQDQYDLILFAEIFEHITFNPIGFWQRIHSLIKQNGNIYISTPNSLTIYAIIKTLYKVITLKGIGLDVSAIFPTVTYGHHWKEYSASEIKTYFNILNNGFQVSITKFNYKPKESTGTVKSSIRNGLLQLGNSIPYFREALEVWVTVDKSQPFKVNIPQY